MESDNPTTIPCCASEGRKDPPFKYLDDAIKHF